MHGKMLGKLKFCLYSTWDAAKGWQETLSAHLETIGFSRGRGHPCVFDHPSRDIKTFVHGDDYVSAGSDESMDWLEAELAKADPDPETERTERAEGGRQSLQSDIEAHGGMMGN